MHEKYHIICNKKLLKIGEMFKEELNKMKLYLKKWGVAYWDTITIGWFTNLHFKIDTEAIITSSHSILKYLLERS